MSDPLRILNKIDLSDLAKVVGKNGDATKELISVLTTMVQALSVDKEAPNVSVNMDVERIIKAMPKTPEAKAPVVNMDMEGLKAVLEPKNSPSYVFDIERDGHGRIKRLTANPVGDV